MRKLLLWNLAIYVLPLFSLLFLMDPFVTNYLGMCESGLHQIFRMINLCVKMTVMTFLSDRSRDVATETIFFGRGGELAKLAYPSSFITLASQNGLEIATPT